MRRIKSALAPLKLIVKRLPMIAVYTLAFFVVFSIASNLVSRYHVAQDKKFYINAPATHFVNYTSFSVQPAREGEDLSYTVCRSHDKNYRVSGDRTAYIIPSGSTEKQKVFVYNKPITNGVVDTGTCQSYFVREAEHHFTPGSYELTLNLSFRVKYNIEKSVFIKSNVFAVRAQPEGGSTDVQSQLNNLKLQVIQLQNLIDQLQSGKMNNAAPTSATRSTTSTTTPGSATSASSAGNTGTAGTTPSTPQQTFVQRLVTGALAPVDGALGQLGL